MRFISNRLPRQQLEPSPFTLGSEGAHTHRPSDHLSRSCARRLERTHASVHHGVCALLSPIYTAGMRRVLASGRDAPWLAGLWTGDWSGSTQTEFPAGNRFFQIFRETPHGPLLPSCSINACRAGKLSLRQRQGNRQAVPWFHTAASEASRWKSSDFSPGTGSQDPKRTLRTSDFCRFSRGGVHI